MSLSPDSSAKQIELDHQYEAFQTLIAERVARVCSDPIFTTDARDLFKTFLAYLPEDSRQHYNCHCCRRFIDTYGGLIVIGSEGEKLPLLWWPCGTPEYFMGAVGRLWDVVSLAKITGVFVSSEKTWGTPQTGEWSHLHGHPDKSSIYTGLTKTASEVAAQRKEDYGILCRGLQEYPREAVVQAIRVLEADVVSQSEKTIGVAKWLLGLHDAKESRQPNFRWLAVATAPPGWCHIKTTMISTLLDDIVAGLDFEDIKRRWNAKMHPLKFQRPTTVSAGNIQQANKIVEKLGAEGSLERRYAKMEDVLSFLWSHKKELFDPTQVNEPATGGAFNHLLGRASGPKKQVVKPVKLPAKELSYEEFVAVLLTAKTIEYKVDNYEHPYYALVTAAKPESPPILQWDGLEKLPRNPVSWYFRHGGMYGRELGLTPGWCKVNAVFKKPNHWQRPEQFKHHGGGVLLAIEGCRWPATTPGGGFFPSFLKSEFHEISKSMEAYAGSSVVAGAAEGDANGICVLAHGKSVCATIRVDGEQEYLLPY